MLTNYENKVIFPVVKKKGVKDLDEEARKGRKAKIIIEVDGKEYASYAAPGQVVQFRDGKRYRVDGNGSLRRVKS